MGVVKGGGEVALMVVEPQPRLVIHLPNTPIIHPPRNERRMIDVRAHLCLHQRTIPGKPHAPVPHASALLRCLMPRSCLMGACSLGCLDGLTDAIHYHTLPHIYCTLLAYLLVSKSKSKALSLVLYHTHTHIIEYVCVCE